MSGGEPRIALLHAFDPREVRRGTERLLEELAAALHSRGRDITVVVAHSGPARREERGGVPFVLLRRPPAAGPLKHHALAHLPAVWRELRRGGYDLAHAFHPADAVAAAAWRRGGGGRTVLTVPAFPYTGPGRARHALLRKAYGADGVVVPTRAVEGAVGRSFPGAATRLIAPGVDTTRFTPGGERTAEPSVFCAADLAEPRKQVELLATAFEKFRESVPAARLILAHPYESEPPRWTGAPSIEVRKIAGDADLIDAYRSAWVSALPARDEPFGLVLTESMACGTPVLGAADGGIPEVIGSGPQGSIVDPADPGEWTQSLATALASPPSEEVAAAARARAERFSMDACVEAYSQAYDELLGVSAAEQP